MPNKKILWLFIVVLILVVAAFFIYEIRQNNRLRQNELLKNFFANLSEQTPILNKNNPTRGNERAKVIIFEYSDFQCPACAQMEPIINKIYEKYKDRVLFVWKDLPNPDHHYAISAAIAARCANDQDKFWQYHDWLFKDQNKLNDAYFLQAAATLGLDQEKFQRCLINPDKQQLISDDLSEGEALMTADVNNSYIITPYFFINKIRIPGFVGEQQLTEVIDQELAKTK